VQANLDQVVSAYGQNRGLTDPVPLCGNTLTHAPAANAYTKPIVLLVNELSAGPAEFLAAMLQDGGRAVVFGGATAGLGTTSNSYPVGAYAEGYAAVSVALAVRPGVVSAPGFPATSYIENIGVRPDVPYDVFTLENAATLGVPYVAAFTETLVAAIEGK
jgi:C-terminal processing protease CtpA/Prc